MVEVVLSEHGFAILPLSIKPLHSSSMIPYLYKVDTGANCTTIGYKHLFDLGYTEAWIKSGRHLSGDARPTVASGYRLDDCYVVVLPEIHIGDYVGYNWPFMTSLSVPFKFLLGTDTMQFFNWTFDYKNWVCKFDLIPDMRKILFNSKEQSIHAVDAFVNRKTIHLYTHT